MEENKTIKKKKSNKFLLFFIICLILLGIYYFKNNIDMDKRETTKDDNENKIPEKEELSYYHKYQSCGNDSLVETEDYIFLDDEIIYECQKKGEYGCYVTTINNFEYCNKTDSLILITDNYKDFLYDYKNKKVILEVDTFTNAIYTDYAQVAYFVFYKDDKAGLASMDGKIILEPIYDSVTLSKPNYVGEFSLQYNIVAAKKGNKVGVIEITTGNEKVPFEYEHIRIYNNYYILMKDNKAILVDSDLQTIIDEDYDDMVIFNGLLVAEKNRELVFYDLNGDKIVEDTVKINKPYSEYSDTGYFVYSMDRYNRVMTIEIFGEDKWEYDSCYNLNIDSKKIEKIDCV